MGLSLRSTLPETGTQRGMPELSQPKSRATARTPRPRRSRGRQRRGCMGPPGHEALDGRRAREGRVDLRRDPRETGWVPGECCPSDRPAGLPRPGGNRNVPCCVTELSPCQGGTVNVTQKVRGEREGGTRARPGANGGGGLLVP